MTSETEALIVFCEGPHDVSFVDKILRHCLSFNRVRNWVFKDYPSPLDKLFSQSVKTHAQEDLSLDMAHKFFLPDRVYESEQQIVLLFNSGGKTKHEQVSTWLSKFELLLEVAKPTTDGDNPRYIESAKYLFLYDADEDGIDKTCRDSESWFAEIDGEEWLGRWERVPNNPFAALSGNKALYLFGADSGEGTLEDWLLPMLHKTNSVLIEKTERVVNDLFDWTIAPNQSQVAMTSKRQKAVITLAGQRKKSGSSMSVVIDQGGCVDNDILKQDNNVKAFADFIEQILKQ